MSDMLILPKAIEAQFRGQRVLVIAVTTNVDGKDFALVQSFDPEREPIIFTYLENLKVAPPDQACCREGRNGGRCF